jgi:hypothetical protein
MSNIYNRLISDNETVELSINHLRVLYCNSFFSCLSFFVLLIIASQISPVVTDAGILINDASVSLKDFSILIPEINNLIPEAKNTTRILGHMIPVIKNGMRQLTLLCDEAPNCY